MVNIFLKYLYGCVLSFSVTLSWSFYHFILSLFLSHFWSIDVFIFLFLFHSLCLSISLFLSFYLTLSIYSTHFLSLEQKMKKAFLHDIFETKWWLKKQKNKKYMEKQAALWLGSLFRHFLSLFVLLFYIHNNWMIIDNEKKHNENKWKNFKPKILLLENCTGIWIRDSSCKVTSLMKLF